MTIPNFGRVTPIQMTMLQLIGYRLSRADIRLATPEAERLQYIVSARKHLLSILGVDFEYVLVDWHNYLIAHKETGYTHPYAFSNVRRAVLRADTDRSRTALIARLRTIERASVWVHGFRLVTPSQGAMLGLLGYRLSPTETLLNISGDESLQTIISARVRLRDLTGEDFGVDISAWRNFLLTHEAFLYTYPYAFSEVETVIQNVRRNGQKKKMRAKLLSRAAGTKN